MTQVLEGDSAIPVTLVEAGPCVITQVRTADHDGYSAIQVGFGTKKKLNKPQSGHLKDLGAFEYLKEFRAKAGETKLDGTEAERGKKFDATIFAVGDTVLATAISKSKGFQGVVKRHGFHGGPASHGQKHSKRAPGSIGSVWPQRVLKGQRMAGRMGGKRITSQNLKVVAIDQENNIIALRGAIPGIKGTLVEIKSEK